ncbi:hypothetical protein ASJ79_05250 [Mycobacterium sp. NAZ190054]|nr:hypothetical protein ASJ79_05250 [Mycobacterium sp. NAZ190054]
MINKFMRSVEMSNDAVADYVADSAAFVDRWLSQSAGPDRVSDDHVLTDDERAAFERMDYEALYALGAHPYLLWHWVEAIFVPRVPWPEMNRQYKEKVARHGYPSYIS